MTMACGNQDPIPRPLYDPCLQPGHSAGRRLAARLWGPDSHGPHVGPVLSHAASRAATGRRLRGRPLVRLGRPLGEERSGGGRVRDSASAAVTFGLSTPSCSPTRRGACCHCPCVWPAACSGSRSFFACGPHSGRALDGLRGTVRATSGPRHHALNQSSLRLPFRAIQRTRNGGSRDGHAFLPDSA